MHFLISAVDALLAYPFFWRVGAAPVEALYKLGKQRSDSYLDRYDWYLFVCDFAVLQYHQCLPPSLCDSSSLCDLQGHTCWRWRCKCIPSNPLALCKASNGAVSSLAVKWSYSQVRLQGGKTIVTPAKALGESNAHMLCMSVSDRRGPRDSFHCYTERQ